ncbi:morphogenetic protein [Yersinia enterocolitica]|uniref:morphogenetic protein n=1 Tax=Yersinia enterocolitica TaxID=630 RepID=UPI003D00413F
MNEKPILFNAEMVNAILSGRKTQTRRIISEKTLHLFDVAASAGECHPLELCDERSQSYYLEFCPLGNPGDQLWVRETWNKHGGLLTYRADHDWIEEMRKATVCPAKWVPSIHMPRWASRINLLITGFRVERLQDISQEDAQAEGMELTGWRPTYSDPDSGGEYETPYDNFAELWTSIYGEESWQANPWVWVIEFERMEAK